MIRTLREKYRFDRHSDRIGPDCFFTHWRLYFKPLMRKLCKAKFAHFDDTAEVRPGVYAIACSNIRVGRRVVLRPSTMLFAEPCKGGASITLEDDVLLGSGVHFYVNNHRFDNPNIPIIEQGHSLAASIVVKRGAWIGANAILLPGVIIGENAVVGAGAVVTTSIPARCVAVGVPAKIIRQL